MEGLPMTAAQAPPFLAFRQRRSPRAGLPHFHSYTPCQSHHACFFPFGRGGNGEKRCVKICLLPLPFSVDGCTMGRAKRACLFLPTKRLWLALGPTKEKQLRRNFYEEKMAVTAAGRSHGIIHVPGGSGGCSRRFSPTSSHTGNAEQPDICQPNGNDGTPGRDGWCDYFG